MIKETINQVLETEKQAEEIIAAAMAEANQISQTTETDLENMRKEFRAALQEYTKTTLDKARAEADKHNAKTMSDAEKEGEGLRKSADTDKAAKYIAEKVLAKYGNS